MLFWGKICKIVAFSQTCPLWFFELSKPILRKHWVPSYFITFPPWVRLAGKFIQRLDFLHLLLLVQLCTDLVQQGEVKALHQMRVLQVAFENRQPRRHGAGVSGKLMEWWKDGMCDVSDIMGWILEWFVYYWVNYNILLTWIKAIWGWFPLSNHDSSEVAVRSL